MGKLFKRNKIRNKTFSKYPCSVYLHNALTFIIQNKPEVAYEEICYALLKAGDKLTSEEESLFKTLSEKHKL